ncbi:uncharacterized protein LOC128371710 [Scomber japonicus]|uniref:uncharacterized protein LOC128371710 n=1 Tax=Scomber japonicus TaxID=13676 RepID=UPI0023062376|nr:uncharacterized protein LOC128371710 [Scomber japonicus]
MERQRTKRGYNENNCFGRHLNLSELKEEAKELENVYLLKENILPYPRPEFHVTHLKHDTNGKGLRGIKASKGFRDPDPLGLVWWNLMVRPEDIQSAEPRLLDQIYPDRTEEQAQKQQSFLGKFATSPAFLDSSRLGSYRFTFPLEEVLTAYSQQLCSGAQPVMRVFKTALYKQEVMYAVLVHSPANQELFSGFPLLTDEPNAVCAYRDGRFIWRPEAMCGTHSFELVYKRDENQVEVNELFGFDRPFYVWDNVAITLHVEEGQVLKFDAERLRENLTYCGKGTPITTSPGSFYTFEYAEALVNDLWPGSESPLERSVNIQAS